MSESSASYMQLFLLTSTARSQASTFSSTSTHHRTRLRSSTSPIRIFQVLREHGLFEGTSERPIVARDINDTLPSRSLHWSFSSLRRSQKKPSLRCVYPRESLHRVTETSFLRTNHSTLNPTRSFSSGIYIRFVVLRGHVFRSVRG